ncbi:hypothetical protein EFT58_07220 [Lactococcus lactis]|nr:hypothetical protein [Lactococcus lactis subsp. lactis]MCT2920382.1 hypothetical protein [Lactococcus lactis]NLS46659.1 hypothetical protein [Lactococcus lactis]
MLRVQPLYNLMIYNLICNCCLLLIIFYIQFSQPIIKKFYRSILILFCCFYASSKTGIWLI